MPIVCMYMYMHSFCIYIYICDMCMYVTCVHVYVCMFRFPSSSAAIRSE